MIDMVLVGLQGHYGYTLGRDAAYLLCFLRLWRVWDLGSDILARHKQTVEQYEARCAASAKRVNTLQAQLEQATSQWRREAEARVRADKLMLEYKAEADTLREALSIAAREQVQEVEGWIQRQRRRRGH